MKKNLLVLFMFVAFAANLGAQTLVSTDVQMKNVVLEEFTGIHCQYCPEGHAIAQAMQNENPGRVVLVNIHQGSYAVPSGSEPDFRTPFGDAIANQSGLSGYPSGTVNRHVFPDIASTTAMGRGSWTTAGGQIMAEVSPVNVGASTSYNEATRELTVNVELYYTSNSPESSNFIQVALLQGGILGPQTGGGMGNNYVHNHMLRYLITDQWGDEVTTTTQNTFVERTYTYTIPADYNGVPCIVEDCQVAVYVTEDHQEIYSGVDVPAIDGTTLITASVSNTGDYVLVGEESVPSTFNLNITNLLSADENFILTLTKENEPAGWNSNFTVAGQTYNETATISLTAGVPTDFSVDVTPDNATGIAKYTFTAQSESNPNAPSIEINLYVMSNVIDLLVNNQGAWTGGTPADLQQDYFDAFEYAEMQQYTSCDYKTFIKIGSEEKLNSIHNIYFNMAWTFPSFTDENVAILASFLDAGGNLFIAGQDIGWDTWDAAGNGTAATKAFYTNYLSADYKADGSTSNNSVYAYAGEEIFGSMTNFSIVDIYGGNMYPDQISPLGDAVSIFKYNNSDSKSAAIRVGNGTYKVVYLGFDPSMAPTADMNEIIKRTEDWFNLGVGVEESLVDQTKLYPNPANNQVTFTGPASGISVYNTLGNLVYKTKTTGESTEINLTDFVSGTYIVRITNESGISSSRLIVY
ncbi:MAG: Omp28-related outer membrane protein [Bacteroidales bacterium]|nr:Omp28-related outer membrane protein [Bacteroidales bacterium]